MCATTTQQPHPAAPARSEPHASPPILTSLHPTQSTQNGVSQLPTARHAMQHEATELRAHVALQGVGGGSGRAAVCLLCRASYLSQRTCTATQPPRQQIAAPCAMPSSLAAASRAWAAPSQVLPSPHAARLLMTQHPRQWHRGQQRTGRQRAGPVAGLPDVAQLQPILQAAHSLTDLHQAASAATAAVLHGGSGGGTSAVPLPAAWAVLADLATALQPSCFDAECQREKDMLLEAR